MQTYTDQQVAEALAKLTLNAGNIKRTATELHIPRPTLIRWRDATAAAINSLDYTAAPVSIAVSESDRDTMDTPPDTVSAADTPDDEAAPTAPAAPPVLTIVRRSEPRPPREPRGPQPPRHDFGALWADAQELALAAAVEIVERVLDDTEPERQASNLRAVASLAHVGAEHHLDYTLGRKGAAVVVNNDNRTQVAADTVILGIIQARQQHLTVGPESVPEPNPEPSS